jgi:mRNA interferase MazF
MNQKNSDVQRGDIFYADLNPVVGSEQGGVRPVLVIQNDVGNKYSPTVIAAAITSQPKKHSMPTHVDVAQQYGFSEDSMVMLEQIRTIDKSRLDIFVGRLDKNVMKKIDEALEISVGLSKQPNWNNAILLCLCPTCAGEFYNTPNYYIKRADINQTTKSTCTRCNVRQGYDFLVVQREK